MYLACAEKTNKKDSRARRVRCRDVFIDLNPSALDAAVKGGTDKDLEEEPLDSLC